MGSLTLEPRVQDCTAGRGGTAPPQTLRFQTCPGKAFLGRHGALLPLTEGALGALILPLDSRNPKFQDSWIPGFQQSWGRISDAVAGLPILYPVTNHLSAVI